MNAYLLKVKKDIRPIPAITVFFKNSLKGYFWMELDIDGDESINNEKLECWSDDESIIFLRAPYWQSDPNEAKNFWSVNEKLFLDYKGKLVYMNEWDDCQILDYAYFIPSIVERIDAYTSCAYNPTFALFEIAKKLVLLGPKSCSVHSCTNIPLVKDDLVKKKKMIFYGSPDNARVGMIRILKDSSLVDQFEGGIISNRFPLHEDFYKDLIVSDFMNFGAYFNKLSESLISLAAGVATNTWSGRHVESMQARCAVVSLPLDLPIDYKFLYKDKIEDLLFYFKRDFSNFLDVCQYCLDNEDECIEKGRAGFEVYKKYWELEYDHSYKEIVWNDITSQFLNLGIEL